MGDRVPCGKRLIPLSDYGVNQALAQLTLLLRRNANKPRDRFHSSLESSHL